MALKIRLIQGLPDYETIQAIKITDYPLEKRDYMPFAQVRLCFSEENLFVQLISFEVTTAPQSEIRASFNLMPETGGKVVSLFCHADGNVGFSVYDGKQEKSFEELGLALPTSRRIDGEDLQGIYWGNHMTCPIAVLKEIFPKLVVKTGRRIKGNLFKICEVLPFKHYGSYYRTDFSKEKLLALDDFIIVNY